MVRYASILVIALGLIIQPVMAYMPAQITEGIQQHTGMLMDADISDHAGTHDISAQISDGFAEMPCHEEIIGDEAMASCDCCDSGCLSGILCGVSLVAVKGDAMTTTAIQRSIPLIMLSKAFDRGSPLIIFRPPRYS
jgi:hypothetical protein